MSAIDREPFPKPALIAAALLIAVSIAGAATARHLRVTAETSVATVAPVAARDVTFADTEAGAVVVREASGAIVYVAQPGADGFIRGVVRGMARDRRARGIGAEPPFRLAEYADGRLALSDTATGKTVELNAFGADNRAAFARILHAGRGV